MITSVQDFKHIFFIGVAGTGMSAIAQYLSGSGKIVSGSDRYFVPGEYNEVKTKLEAAGIQCFLQNGEGVHAQLDLVVVSTAVEDTVPEVQKARALNIPIIKRSELLALIARSKRTIAVGGTSGKSTTSAMLFQILEKAGMAPSIISGAGLVSIIKEGRIGNAKVGEGAWLIIEADESDGSIVQYHPEISVLLNVDKDHQDIEELMNIFSIFKTHTKGIFITNRNNALAAKLSENAADDFGEGTSRVGNNYVQTGIMSRFKIGEVEVNLNMPGKHNMENALAAIAVCNAVGLTTSECAAALQSFEGIYRRHQLLGKKENVWVVDDYAHNPAKCAASIRACQQDNSKLIAWFQPHGYKPTKFLKDDFIEEIASALRPQDEIWMSEIYYAGGTAVKDISAKELTDAINDKGKNAFFVEDRNQLLQSLRPHLKDNCILLLMGARDPSLEDFAKSIYQDL